MWLLNNSDLCFSPGRQLVHREWSTLSVLALLQWAMNRQPVGESWERSRLTLHYEVDAHYSVKLHVGERQGQLYFYIVYTFCYVRTVQQNVQSNLRSLKWFESVKCFDIWHNCVHCTASYSCSHPPCILILIITQQQKADCRLISFNSSSIRHSFTSFSLLPLFFYISLSFSLSDWT